MSMVWRSKATYLGKIEKAAYDQRRAQTGSQPTQGYMTALNMALTEAVEDARRVGCAAGDIDRARVNGFHRANLDAARR